MFYNKGVHFLRFISNAIFHARMNCAINNPTINLSQIVYRESMSYEGVP